MPGSEIRVLGKMISQVNTTASLSSNDTNQHTSISVYLSSICSRINMCYFPCSVLKGIDFTGHSSPLFSWRGPKNAQRDKVFARSSSSQALAGGTRVFWLDLKGHPKGKTGFVLEGGGQTTTQPFGLLGPWVNVFGYFQRQLRKTSPHRECRIWRHARKGRSQMLPFSSGMCFFSPPCWIQMELISVLDLVSHVFQGRKSSANGRAGFGLRLFIPPPDCGGPLRK